MSASQDMDIDIKDKNKDNKDNKDKDNDVKDPRPSFSVSSPPNPKKKEYSREYWKEEEENILREWADKAQCYEIMHSRSHEIYNYKNTLFVIPVIIISTITGTANFAQDRVPSNYQSIFVMVVGGLNILAAIISTIAQYLKISELNESYRVGTLQWGKFYRNIKTELAKHPLDRVPPTNMLSICKEEFDRLLEIYPEIPQKVVNEFKNKFENIDGMAKPEICDAIEPTIIYPMSNEERLSMINKINHITKPQPKPEKIIEFIKLEEEDSTPNQEQQEYKERVLKFQQTFFKINNRPPTDEEIQLVFNESSI
jgi:hypothetical protein